MLEMSATAIHLSLRLPVVLYIIGRCSHTHSKGKGGKTEAFTASAQEPCGALHCRVMETTDECELCVLYFGYDGEYVIIIHSISIDTISSGMECLIHFMAVSCSSPMGVRYLAHPSSSSQDSPLLHLSCASTVHWCSAANTVCLQSSPHNRGTVWSLLASSDMFHPRPDL